MENPLDNHLPAEARLDYWLTLRDFFGGIFKEIHYCGCLKKPYSYKIRFSLWEKENDVESHKNIPIQFLIFVRGLSQNLHRLFGNFENTLGQHAVPSGLRYCVRSVFRVSFRPLLGSSGMACCPRWSAKSLPGSNGSGIKSPLKNHKFSIHIFF